MPPRLVPKQVPTEGSKWTREQADAALRRMLDATIAREKAVSERDSKISKIMWGYGVTLTKSDMEIEILEAQLERYYRAHPPADVKSVQLQHGLIGMRSSPGELVPLDKWTWEKATAAVRKAFKGDYFHKPKAPGLDKVKLKSLPAEQLAKVGLKVQSDEKFYIDLNRLDEAA